MKSSLQNNVRIAQLVGGEGFILTGVRFGGLHSGNVLNQIHARRSRLIGFPHIGHDHDETIRDAFEHLRKGLSADRFLSDPALSKILQKECRRRGLTAPEPAINLRLLAIRKSAGGSGFKGTEHPARARHLVERFGPGVEAAMKFVLLRFGASVDDMLAHPAIGAEFSEVAQNISPGATEIEYRLCALQVRKGRHLSGAYEQRVEELDSQMIARRWENLGTPDEAEHRDIPAEPGLLELSADTQSLYVLRTSLIGATVASTFAPNQVRRLLKTDLFSEYEHKRLNLRYVRRKDLQFGSPKSWELRLIKDRQPIFNWPVSEAA
jgi:hypothetical protein